VNKERLVEIIENHTMKLSTRTLNELANTILKEIEGDYEWEGLWGLTESFLQLIALDGRQFIGKKVRISIKEIKEGQ